MRIAVSRVARLDLAACLGTVVVFLVAQALLLHGPQPYDPGNYFRSALNFPNVPADAWTLRIGLMGPLAMIVRSLGPSELTLFAIPVTASAVLAASVFGIIRVLFHDRLVAVCAALVVVLNQDYLLDSTSLFPDVLATAVFAAGLFFLLLARDREQPVLEDQPALEDQPGDRKRRRPSAPTVAAAVAGALFGWTYLIREFSPVLFPVVLLALVLWRYPRRRTLVVVGSAAIVICIEFVYGYVRYGNALERLKVLTTLRSSHELAQWTPYFKRVHNIPEAAWVLPRTLLTWRTGWPVLLLLVVFIVGVARFRDRRLWLLAAWLGIYWAMMAVLGGVRTKYGAPRLGIGYVRYWYPALPAFLMGGIAAVWLFVRGSGDPPPRRRKVAHLAVVVVALAAVVPGVVEYSGCESKDVWDTEPLQRWEQVAGWLATPTAARYDRIMSDVPSRRMLPAFTRTAIGKIVWHGKLGVIPLGDLSLRPSRDTLVLVDRRHGPTDIMQRLGPHWSLTFVTSDGVIGIMAKHVRSASPAALMRWQLPPTGFHGQADTCGVSPYRVY
ncbi:MAG TPA: hypothetical protein VFJ17_04505 [Mycobacteriales bacterium]|jgi:hypothetical protein|nr:hypothetical protein [Mycobacteriales bacterium]